MEAFIVGVQQNPLRVARRKGVIRGCSSASGRGGAPSAKMNLDAVEALPAGKKKADGKDNGRHLESHTVTDSYGADKIRVLEGLEPVRKRPGMYIGSTGPKGLHHLIFEVVDNSVDEALAGHCKEIEVIIGEGCSVEVRDDGRGIPTAKHPTTGKSALETVLTVLHAGGKFGDGGYKVSGGLHGVGVSVVNALSDELEVNVWRNKTRYSMHFTRGFPDGPIMEAPDDSRTSGTSVKFHPDPLIFRDGVDFSWDTLASRLRELAFLTAGLKITLTDERLGKEQSEEYLHEGGIREYLELLSHDKTPLHAGPISFRTERNGMIAELVLQWCSDYYSESMYGFVNNIRTVDGGTHLDGFKFALTKAVNNLGKASGKIKSSIGTLSGDFVREGLYAILSVKVPDPEFEGQTKTRLGNPEVREFVRTSIEDELVEYFGVNPKVLNDVIEKASQAHAASAAARSARDLVRRKTVLESSTLPGKLADCASRDPAESEIFIVEGDSAGGSAKQARNRHSQAILPLRGKIINIEKVDDARMYQNTEVQAVIQALGLGFKGEPLELPKIRYHRIIIMTDADVDGAHIRTLLLTLFFRYQKELIAEGLVYIACPPLYKLSQGKKTVYAYNDQEMQSRLAKMNHPRVVRFKGLGEMMPDELWHTTMNPESRLLKQVSMDDALAADTIFPLLMGDNVDNRREYIQSHAESIDLDRIDF